MSKKYWLDYYKIHNKIQNPSDFAFFCSKYVVGNLIDVGCGSGRDSYYFGLSRKVLGIDQNVLPKFVHNVNFHKGLFEQTDFQFETTYSRFLLHSISNESIRILIKKTKRIFMAECRSKGDKPILYPDHKRNFIDGNWLVSELIDNGFEIIYLIKDHGLAVLGHEDPLIIRVIARRK